MPSPARAFVIGLILATIAALAIGPPKSIRAAMIPAMPGSPLLPDPDSSGRRELPPGRTLAKSEDHSLPANLHEGAKSLVTSGLVSSTRTISIAIGPPFRMRSWNCRSVILPDSTSSSRNARICKPPSM